MNTEHELTRIIMKKLYSKFLPLKQSMLRDIKLEDCDTTEINRGNIIVKESEEELKKILDSIGNSVLTRRYILAAIKIIEIIIEINNDNDELEMVDILREFRIVLNNKLDKNRNIIKEKRKIRGTYEEIMRITKINLDLDFKIRKRDSFIQRCQILIKEIINLFNAGFGLLHYYIED